MRQEAPLLRSPAALQQCCGACDGPCLSQQPALYLAVRRRRLWQLFGPAALRWRRGAARRRWSRLLRDEAAGAGSRRVGDGCAPGFLSAWRRRCRGKPLSPVLPRRCDSDAALVGVFASIAAGAVSRRVGDGCLARRRSPPGLLSARLRRRGGKSFPSLSRSAATARHERRCLGSTRVTAAGPWWRRVDNGGEGCDSSVRRHSSPSFHGVAVAAAAQQESSPPILPWRDGTIRGPRALRRRALPHGT